MKGLFDVTTQGNLIQVWFPGEGTPRIELEVTDAAELANAVLYAIDEIRALKGWGR